MSDTLFALWIGLSVAMLLLFLFAAVASLRNRQGRPVALEELIPSFVPVDVEAFADLIGSAADGVGQELSPEEFVALQRRRTQLAMKSLRRMASNAIITAPGLQPVALRQPADQ